MNTSGRRSFASDAFAGKVLYDEWEGKVPCGIIIPDSRSKGTWDTMVLFIIIYSAFAVPVEMCFDSYPTLGSWVFVFECGVSIIFVMDMIFAFNTV